MSEEFLMAVCPDLREFFPTIEEAKASITNNFQKMAQNNQIREDELDLIFMGQVWTEHPEEGTTYPPEESDYLTALEDSLDYLWELPNDMTSWVDSAGLPFWITGGMSGGDSPTESFDHIIRIALVAELAVWVPTKQEYPGNAIALAIKNSGEAAHEKIRATGKQMTI